jgi:multidrug transporter EmrE-like cation transporter
MTVSPLVGGTLLSMVEIFGDYAIKRYAQGAGWPFLAVGTGVYLSLVGILVWLFQTLGLAITNSFWDGTSNIISMVVAACFLKETYTLKQWIGMGIVGAGLFIIGH